MKKPIRGRASGYKRGVMNKTEEEYAEILEQNRLAGEIQAWHFESVRLVLAPKLTYTPDFMVVNKDSEIEMHEVKGFWRDDAKVKVKLANDKFPFVFKICMKEKKSWVIEEL